MIDTPKPTTPPVTSVEHRVIRVFISSTFCDMHAEREELIKFTFPEVRKRCRERGVEFVDVDLRWGITDEQKAEGKVLTICLAEIERCRPYFIGLLGERYGWVPEEIDEELVSGQPWLKEHKEKSVTELEIIHGVLKNPDMADHAFFYFRDPETSRQIEEQLSGEPDYQPEPDTSREKLRSLKESIEQSRFPVRKGYSDTKKLGELVLRDLTEVINRLYPEGPQPDSLERDAADHEAFAQSRAGVYIGRPEYFECLDNYVAGHGPPLVILGESGSGKSALLANWFLRYREKISEKSEKPDLLLMHFVGASPYSADWATMLRRIMGEFKRRFNIHQDIPDKPDELRSAFANYLHMAAAKGRVILILDALNQLEDRDGALDLVWLPPVIPSNIRLILSTLPGKSLDDLKKRGWPVMKVQPLNQEERRLFIEKYLAQYTKALSPARAEHIANVKQTTNPLYLQALLEELRLFGRHEQLDERISYYLEAETIPDLYGKILTRYEEDYDEDKPGLVRDVMSCLWAARRGLLESELLDILGSDESPLPKAVWSPLNLAAEHSLINRSGLIGFSHNYFRQAVQSKYLSTEKKQVEAHLRLSDYFSKLDISVRMVDELPWQFARAKAWERLKDLLTQPRFFESAWEADQFDVKVYWTQLEDNFYHKVDAYRSVLEAPEQTDYSFVWKIATLLDDTGHPVEALLMRKSLVERFRQADDKVNLQASLGNQAAILQDRGELDDAMRLYKEQERICRELGNKDGLQASLGNQALILKDRGELDEAMRLHKEEERICLELGNKDGLSISLGNQALILKARGELDEAMR
ncbi:DUF4062 domain-containing protein, partial [Dehalococcoidia bacterium]|nr:DUF4062 domain-containing protein [Dehalococcoidia bacterium]